MFLGKALGPFLAVIGLVLLSFAAQAQDAQQSGVGVEAWGQTALEAERVLNNPAATDAELDAVRARIAIDRSQARTIVETGSVEARALRAQLEVLGPAPDDPASEPEPLRKQREELSLALAKADVPVVQAEMAFRRADTLIKELDHRIRGLNNTQLLSGGPSPLLPTAWVAAATEGLEMLKVATWTTGQAFTGPVDQLVQRLFRAILLIAGGTFILVVGYRGMLRRFETTLIDTPHKARRAALIGASYAARFVVPAIGGYLIVGGLFALGIGTMAEDTVGAVLILTPFAVIGAHWLGTVAFAPSAPALRFVTVSDETARAGRRYCDGLGWTLVAGAVVEAAKQAFRFTPEALSVFAAIVVLMGSFFLWNLAKVLLLAKDQAEEVPARDGLLSQSVLNAIARLMQLSVVAAIVASLVGYTQLAQQALFPMILSLGLVVISLMLQAIIVAAIHGFMGIRKSKNTSLSGLVPVIVGIAVFLISLPLYAMVWGARTTDLSEAWILASEGVDLGGVRLSANALIVLIMVFAIGLFLTRWLQSFLEISVLPKTRMDTGGRNAVVTGVGYLGVTAAALLAVSLAGLNLSNLAIVAGALSVGIGFGLQAVVSNFVSGIILLVERPVKEGDWIEVAGQTGIVRKIAVRSTRIETFDRHDVIVPNSELITGVVKNMMLSSKSGRIIVPVGVGFDSDLDRVRDLLLAAARDHNGVLAQPAPLVMFMGIGEYALNFELRCFVGDVTSGALIRSDLFFDIFRDLRRAGIEIPFPQRDVQVRPKSQPRRATRKPAARDTKQA